MRWKATPPAVIWKRAFKTRLGAFVAAVPCFVCWIAALVSYAGLVAILYVPRVPIFDILSPLAGHFLGLGISAVVGLMAARQSILILACGTTLTVLAHSVPAFLPDRPLQTVSPIAEANARPVAELTVMAFNVWNENGDPGLLAQVIERSGADVVLLSEVTDELRSALERVRHLYPHAAFCDTQAPCDQGLLSRIALADISARPAAADRPTMVSARLAGPGPFAGLRLVSAHIFRPTRGFHRHTQQRDGLIAELAGIDGPLVVGGDLNVTRGTHSFASLTHRAGLSGADRALPSWPAYPLPLPQFGLDHILVRGALTITRAGVGPYGGSDHLPVWVKIVATGKGH